MDRIAVAAMYGLLGFAGMLCPVNGGDKATGRTICYWVESANSRDDSHLVDSPCVDFCTSHFNRNDFDWREPFLRTRHHFCCCLLVDRNVPTNAPNLLEVGADEQTAERRNERAFKSER